MALLNKLNMKTLKEYCNLDYNRHLYGVKMDKRIISLDSVVDSIIGSLAKYEYKRLSLQIQIQIRHFSI